MSHLRAVPDPDDEPVVDLVEPVEAPAAEAPEAPDAPEADAAEEDGTDDLSRRYPSTIGGAFYLSILVVAGTALVIAARSDWRLGMQVFGGSLIVAALLRLVLANRDAGMLAVRNRFLDSLLLTGAGVALIVLAGSIPDMPVA